MRVALCICTRNRPEEVVKALAGAAHSLLPLAQILVSDDSDEAQAARTRDVCATLGVTYIYGPHRGLSANRNHCLDHLDVGIEAVAFIDDDVIIRPDFLSEAAKALHHAPLRTIITGRENKDGVDVTPHNCSFWGHQEVPPRDEDDYHTIVINTTLFPRELFEQVRFDEALRYGSEEADICAQAEALGYRIQYESGISNDHYPSLVNRGEYPRFIEASRLYTTYKRYLLLERNRGKAIIYALLAPLHLLVSLCKKRQLRYIPTAVNSICLAYRFGWAATRRMPEKNSPLRLQGVESKPCL